MKFSIVTLFPELYKAFLDTSLVRKAQEDGIIKFGLKNLFDFCKNRERVDSPTFGHNAGMLIKPTVVQRAVEEAEQLDGKAFKIFFSPHGKKLNQDLLVELYGKIKNYNHVMVLPARYEGMDARAEEHYSDAVISIGDYVLMGGDLPAMVFIESLLRFFPGVVGSQESVEKDSFSGPFLDHPEYCEPAVWNGKEVPEVIRSGNHKKIEQWQKQQSIDRTISEDFSWLRTHVSGKDDISLAYNAIPSHYAILMHSQIVLKSELGEKIEGTSSVTSLDIHDIARSAKTYGIKKYFIVTPLLDQQKIVGKLLSFWKADVGLDYNPHRHEALADVVLVSTLKEAVDIIESIECLKPILAATATKKFGDKPILTYHDQSKIWSLKRPFVFVFGTARGLAPSLLNDCDYIMQPLMGFSEFNHLSVRSAAAIVFDRWLGINLVGKS